MEILTSFATGHHPVPTPSPAKGRCLSSRGLIFSLQDVLDTMDGGDKVEKVWRSLSKAMKT